MYMHEWVGYGFFMPLMFVFPLILLLVFLLMRSSGYYSYHKPHAKEDEALEIARKRFARGEIDEETFDKIKQKLS